MGDTHIVLMYKVSSAHKSDVCAPSCSCRVKVTHHANRGWTTSCGQKREDTFTHDAAYGTSQAQGACL
jgi:hypothetical protein